MIVLLVATFHLSLKPEQKQAAINQSKRDVQGSMEGHAQMSMAKRQGRWRDRLTSRQGWVAISHGFVMNWAMLWKDILVGVIVAGALGAWVPDSFWLLLFLTDHPLAASIWGAFLGPLIAIASFTCSVGNIPFAAMLWRGGISFGGVIAFIFRDLIIPPILNIYRKYYGRKMTLYLFITFYLVMVTSALLVEWLFALMHLVPHGARHGLGNQDISFNYTTVLDVTFATIGVGLYVLYVRTGGPKMMRQMQSGGHGAHH